MEVSRVSITQETRDKLARAMSPRHRLKIREQLMKDHIAAQVAGKKIRPFDLIRAAGFDTKDKNEYAKGWYMVKRLVARKEIMQQSFPHSTLHIYSLPAKKVSTKPVEKAEEPVKEDNHVDSEGRKMKMEPVFDMHLTEIAQLEEVSAGWVIQQAKEFAWQYDSDSLREFIKLLETKVKVNK